MIGVLNNDTLVTAGFTAPLLAALRAVPGPSAVSPDIRYADDPDVSWYRGATLDRATGSPVHLARDAQPEVTRGPCDTDLLTGCCILAGAPVWRDVGGFDEGLFLIFEDSDWSMRARRRGVRLAVVPASRIDHRVSRSFTGDTARLATFYFARNGVVFVRRHGPSAAVPRFVWRRVLRPTLASARRERTGVGLLLALIGLVAGACGTGGPAGPRVVALARRGAGGRRERAGRPRGRAQPGLDA